MTEKNHEYSQNIRKIRERLIEAFGLPEWRNPMPPVDELVSTILSQNTNDNNRDAAFNQLKEIFPDWDSVAAANTADVVEAVRTAGLANQKAPRIQDALREIKRHNAGSIDLGFLRDMKLEDAREWLLGIKGVGPKTAAIVLLFSMGIPAFPVDTHIYRVTGRIGIRPEKISVEKAHEYFEKHIPEDAYYDLHLNFIRLGREVCGARKWNCYCCPIADLCSFEEKTLSPDDL